jgi:hypothetical protein
VKFERKSQQTPGWLAQRMEVKMVDEGSIERHIGETVADAVEG